MEIAKDTVVSATYELVVDGETIETVTEKEPMKFIFGTGYLLPKFEEYILGKKEGDTFGFTLSAADSYGEINKDAIVELPKTLFEVDGKIEEGLLVVGHVLPMMDSEGNRLNGNIEEVKDETIIMNFNHPLAGKSLTFSGKILEVRAATEEELTNGLYGEKAHSCGDGCGSSCGDGCSCGCGCH